MIKEKTQRELLELIDFAAASTFLSGRPINPELIESYKDLIKNGINAIDLFLIIAEDRERILQRIEPKEGACP